LLKWLSLRLRWLVMMIMLQLQSSILSSLGGSSLNKKNKPDLSCILSFCTSV
jgi:hypothetical protein